MAIRRARRLMALAQVGVALLLLGVAPFDCMEPRSPVIKLGFAGPLSGLDAPLGNDMHRGVRLAVEEWDAAPKPGKYRVDLVALDDEGRPEKARETARELAIDPDVKGVVGNSGSVGALAALPEYRQAGLAVVFPNATADALAESGAFRLAAGERLLVEALLARFGSARRVALVSQEGWPSGLLGQQVVEELERRGASVVLRQTVKGDQARFSSLIVALVSANPDLVVLNLNYPQAALLARETPLPRRSVLTVGGPELASPNFLAMAHGAAEGFVYATGLPPVPPLPSTAPFRDEFRKRAGLEPGADAAAAYDAARLLLEAMQRAAKSGGKPLRPDVARQLSRTEAEGILGHYAFTSSGERLGARAYVWKVTGAGAVLVE